MENGGRTRRSSVLHGKRRGDRDKKEGRMYIGRHRRCERRRNMTIVKWSRRNEDREGGKGIARKRDSLVSCGACVVRMHATWQMEGQKRPLRWIDHNECSKGSRCCDWCRGTGEQRRLEEWTMVTATTGASLRVPPCGHVDDAEVGAT